MNDMMTLVLVHSRDLSSICGGGSISRIVLEMRKFNLLQENNSNNVNHGEE